MSILGLQKRARQLGEIRIGQVVPTSNGKTRPAKLDKFRLTSPSRPLLESVAALYGGTVQEWTPANGGATEWEVLTDSARLPILVPPQPVTQHYELYAGSVCQRRCDGQTELKSDRPCMCDPDNRTCSITTRLNVLLRDVPGVGVWLLTTKGWYAATELPAVAEFLAQAGGYVNAFLSMEERVVKRVTGDKTETLRFMVPTLEVEVTPAELMAGRPGVVVPRAIEAGGRPAIEAAPAPPAPPGEGEPDWPALITGATTREELLGIRADAIASGVTGARATALDAALAGRGREIAAASPEPDEEEDSEAVRDRLWAEIAITAATRFDTTKELEDDFWMVTGKKPDEATAANMRGYQAYVQHAAQQGVSA